MFAIFVLFSCKKKEIFEDGIPKNMMKQFITDSVKVEDSIKISDSLTAKYSGSVLIFKDFQNEVLLDSIYKNAGLQIAKRGFSKEGLIEVLNNEKQNYFKKTKQDFKEGYSSDFQKIWYQDSNMKIISNKNDILVIQYSSSGYLGGAHGFYGESYKNFDLKNNKVFQLTDIFKNLEKINWNDILMKKFNQLDFDGEKKGDNKDILLVDKIPANNNFYFDEKNFTFVYNQYEIAPYAVGVVEIHVPFSELKPYLKQEFVQRIGIK